MIYNRLEMSPAGEYSVDKRCHCELCGKYLRRRGRFKNYEEAKEFRSQDEVCAPCADTFWRKHRGEVK